MPSSPFFHKGRGEPDPIWLEDDSEYYKDRPFLEVIARIRKARKIIDEHNAKPMAIDAEEYIE